MDAWIQDKIVREQKLGERCFFFHELRLFEILFVYSGGWFMMDLVWIIPFPYPSFHPSLKAAKSKGRCMNAGLPFRSTTGWRRQRFRNFLRYLYVSEFFLAFLMDCFKGQLENPRVIGSQPRLPHLCLGRLYSSAALASPFARCSLLKC